MYNTAFQLADPFGFLLVAKSLSDGHILTQTLGALSAPQLSVHAVSGVLYVTVFGLTVAGADIQGESFVLSVEENNWLVSVTLNGKLIAKYVYAGDVVESSPKLVLGGYSLANGTVVSDWTGHIGYFGLYTVPAQEMIKRDVKWLVKTWN